GGAPAPRERWPAGAQRGAGRRGARPEGGRGRGRGARAQRAGHDQARRGVLPRGRGRGAAAAAAASGGGAMSAIWAVVPAAGRGTRFGSETPKQYLEVGGRPLLAYTLDALLAHPAVAGVVLAVSADDRWWPGWTEHAGKPVRTCTGGDSRAASVLAALEALPESVRPDEFVLVHDAARPNLAA